MKFSCLIADDEPLAREGMEQLVRDTGFLDLKATCGSVMEANEFLSKEKIDLLFLDIQMPKISGIAFLRSLSVAPLVIITTAYPNFALEGFELNVLDYLVKPITPERFLLSVNRARELLEVRKQDGNTKAIDYFFIKCSYGFEKISLNEIIYVEANQNYCIIYTTRGKFMTLTTLGSLEKQLPSGKFLRIQKSYIVSLDKIQSVSGNEITADRYKIPVSKNYRDVLMKLINSQLIKK